MGEFRSTDVEIRDCFIPEYPFLSERLSTSGLPNEGKLYKRKSVAGLSESQGLQLENEEETPPPKKKPRVHFHFANQEKPPQKVHIVLYSFKTISSQSIGRADEDVYG